MKLGLAFRVFRPNTLCSCLLLAHLVAGLTGDCCLWPDCSNDDKLTESAGCPYCQSQQWLNPLAEGYALPCQTSLPTQAV